MADTIQNTAASAFSRASRTTHTPLIRLQAARQRVDLACIACPHWDYETDSFSSDRSDCCDELEVARRELRAARKAVRP